MDEVFDIDNEIENIKAAIMKLQGRLELLIAIIEGGYKITKAQQGEETTDNGTAG